MSDVSGPTNSDRTVPKRRKRAVAACDRCRRRKKKCDGTSPCANCRKADCSCTYASWAYYNAPPPASEDLSASELPERQPQVQLQTEAQTAENQCSPAGGDSSGSSEIPANPTSESPRSTQHNGPAVQPPLLRQDREADLQAEIDRLKAELNSLRREQAFEAGDSIQEPPGTTEDPETDNDTSILLNAIWNLLNGKTPENTYIGSTAIISKVNAIKQLMLGNHFQESPPHPSNPLKQPENTQKTTKTDEWSVLHARLLEPLFVKFYLNFICHRYQFIEPAMVKKLFPAYCDKQSSSLKYLETSSDSLAGQTHYEKCLSFLVLATGCRLRKLSKSSTSPLPETYFDKMLHHLTLISTPLDSVQQIRLIMSISLYLIYCYDSTNRFALNVWELSGMAIRKLTQVGAHRFKYPSVKLSKDYELMKRLFWSVYAFEKLLCLILGRPALISDNEIDVPYPLSIESVEDLSDKELYNLQIQQQICQYQLGNHRVTLPDKVTLTTYLVQLCRIREIEGRITSQERKFHVPVPRSVLNSHRVPSSSETQWFTKNFSTLMADLEQWKAQLPAPDAFNKGTRNRVPFEYLLLSYYRAKLLLLLTRLINTQYENQPQRYQLLVTTCDAAGGVCKAYLDLYRDAIFGFSMFSLHTIFLVGVTLAYCIVNLENEPSFAAAEGGSNTGNETGNTRKQGHWRFHNYIRHCSMLLYAFSERTKKADSFRILFDKLLENNLYNKEFTVSSAAPANHGNATDKRMDLSNLINERANSGQKDTGNGEVSMDEISPASELESLDHLVTPDSSNIDVFGEKFINNDLPDNVELIGDFNLDDDLWIKIGSLYYNMLE